jgi:hypothetical protein
VRGIGTGTALCSIGQLPGNEEATLAANLHACESLVEAGNQAAHPLRKCHGLRIAELWLAVIAHHGLAIFVLHRRAGMVEGRVEFVAVVGASVAAEPAGVLHLVHFVGLGIGAGS